MSGQLRPAISMTAWYIQLQLLSFACHSISSSCLIIWSFSANSGKCLALILDLEPDISFGKHHLFLPDHAANPVHPAHHLDHHPLHCEENQLTDQLAVRDLAPHLREVLHRRMLSGCTKV